MKKLLFLGAAKFQTPPIIYARKAGYQIFTCDNRPLNPGHALAHRSFDLSTVDQTSVLRVADKLEIDGIVSFGSDVSAPTAAFVAEKLGLPGPSLESIDTLVNKDHFRQFLHRTKIQPWQFQAFSSKEQAEAFSFAEMLGFPCVVKPVDASGSRGVAVVRTADSFRSGLQAAIAQSRSSKIIVESFFYRSGPQVCGDGFMEDGHLKFIDFGDGHFHDADGFLAPFGETFPSSHSQTHLNTLRNRLEICLFRSGYKQGPFNFDCLIDKDGTPFIIEIGPRNGGNFLPNAIRHRTGVDTIAATVEMALNRKFQLSIPKCSSKKFIACYMVHSRTAGILKCIDIAKEVRNQLIEENPYIVSGDRVSPFHQANTAIANFIFEFGSQREMLEKMSRMSELCVPILAT